MVGGLIPLSLIDDLKRQKLNEEVGTCFICHFQSLLIVSNVDIVRALGNEVHAVQACKSICFYSIKRDSIKKGQIRLLNNFTLADQSWS